PVSYSRFHEHFARIAVSAGIEGAQARDLRRTAMVNMALSGATAPQIASVSGHSIEATARILETYLPRNRALADPRSPGLTTTARPGGGGISGHTRRQSDGLRATDPANSHRTNGNAFPLKGPLSY